MGQFNKLSKLFLFLLVILSATSIYSAGVPGICDHVDDEGTADCNGLCNLGEEGFSDCKSDKNTGFVNVDSFCAGSSDCSIFTSNLFGVVNSEYTSSNRAGSHVFDASISGVTSVVFKQSGDAAITSGTTGNIYAYLFATFPCYDETECGAGVHIVPFLYKENENSGFYSIFKNLDHLDTSDNKYIYNSRDLNKKLYQPFGISLPTDLSTQDYKEESLKFMTQLPFCKVYYSDTVNGDSANDCDPVSGSGAGIDNNDKCAILTSFTKNTDGIFGSLNGGVYDDDFDEGVHLKQIENAQHNYLGCGFANTYEDLDVSDAKSFKNNFKPLVISKLNAKSDSSDIYKKSCLYPEFNLVVEHGSAFRFDDGYFFCANGEVDQIWTEKKPSDITTEGSYCDVVDEHGACEKPNPGWGKVASDDRKELCLAYGNTVWYEDGDVKYCCGDNSLDNIENSNPDYDLNLGIVDLDENLYCMKNDDGTWQISGGQGENACAVSTKYYTELDDGTIKVASEVLSWPKQDVSIIKDENDQDLPEGTNFCCGDEGNDDDGKHFTYSQGTKGHLICYKDYDTDKYAYYDSDPLGETREDAVLFHDKLAQDTGSAYENEYYNPVGNFNKIHTGNKLVNTRTLTGDVVKTCDSTFSGINNVDFLKASEGDYYFNLDFNELVKANDLDDFVSVKFSGAECGGDCSFIDGGLKMIPKNIEGTNAGPVIFEVSNLDLDLTGVDYIAFDYTRKKEGGVFEICAEISSTYECFNIEKYVVYPKIIDEKPIQVMIPTSVFSNLNLISGLKFVFTTAVGIDLSLYERNIGQLKFIVSSSHRYCDDTGKWLGNLDVVKKSTCEAVSSTFNLVSEEDEASTYCCGSGIGLDINSKLTHDFKNGIEDDSCCAFGQVFEVGELTDMTNFGIETGSGVEKETNIGLNYYNSNSIICHDGDSVEKAKDFLEKYNLVLEHTSEKGDLVECKEENMCDMTATYYCDKRINGDDVEYAWQESKDMVWGEGTSLGGFFEKPVGTYVKDSSPLDSGCCMQNQCFNGVVCVDGVSEKEDGYNYGKDQAFELSLGNIHQGDQDICVYDEEDDSKNSKWVNAFYREAPSFDDFVIGERNGYGYCLESSQCFDGTKCVDSETVDDATGKYYCYEGEWSSNLKQLMLELDTSTKSESEDYVIYCDSFIQTNRDFKEMLPVLNIWWNRTDDMKGLSQSTKVVGNSLKGMNHCMYHSKDKMVMYSTFPNKDSLLKYVRGVLNITEFDVTNAELQQEIYSDSTDHKFHKKLYVNNDAKIVAWSNDKSFSFTPNDKSVIRKIFDFFSSIVKTVFSTDDEKKGLAGKIKFFDSYYAAYDKDSDSILVEGFIERFTNYDEESKSLIFTKEGFNHEDGKSVYVHSITEKTIGDNVLGMSVNYVDMNADLMAALESNLDKLVNTGKINSGNLKYNKLDASTMEISLVTAGDPDMYEDSMIYDMNTDTTYDVFGMLTRSVRPTSIDVYS